MENNRYVELAPFPKSNHIYRLTFHISIFQIHWFCEDCGTEYDTADIESRLIQHVHRRMMRYQMQDIRCSKTNRVATNTLSRVSACGADFKPDITPNSASSELQTLCDLARRNELEELFGVTTGILSSFR